MIDTIYIEKEAMDDEVTRSILERVKPAHVLEIERYGEVFNPNSQNFRLQKLKPALILARKHGRRVLPAPPDYNIGGQHNFYFSHMLNCIYDCRYCFLQGMYRSGNYVVFTNYQNFFDEIDNTLQELTDGEAWFYSGYDCDSLALEPVTSFMEKCLDFFETRKAFNGAQPMLEIRTKSTQIRPLLKRPAVTNCVVAYSLSPESVVTAVEHKTPSLKKRISALAQLQQAGWKIGLRFDPLIAADNFDSLYQEMFDSVFAALDTSKIHSVSLGTFRLPKPFHRSIRKLYPDEPILAVPMFQQTTDNKESQTPLVSYHPQREQKMMDFCRQRILDDVDQSRLFCCV